MKFLVVGLGSMGKRRVRNLHQLKAGEVIGFDVRKDRREETKEKYGITVFKKFDDAMHGNPDVIIISSPPNHHLEYVKVAVKNNKHFFTELNAVSLPILDEMISLTERARIVGVPSSTMRFHPCVKTLKRIVDENEIGKVLSIIYHSGDYLRDWHPWEDIKDFYVSSKETGGGRDQLMFEVDWIRWVMGEVKGVSCMARKLSEMNVDIYDFYQLLLDFENDALGNVIVDVIQRLPNRHCKLLSEEGLAVWDWMGKHAVWVFDAKNKTWKEYPDGQGYKGYSAEEMYVDEMNLFLKAINGQGEYTYNFKDERRVLEIVFAAERSSQEGIYIKL